MAGKITLSLAILQVLKLYAGVHSSRMKQEEINRLA